MSRILAWLVTLGYLGAMVMSIGLSAAALVALFLAAPLACILYPETMADYGRFARRDALPPGLVFGLGWFVLLLPAILAGVVRLML